MAKVKFFPFAPGIGWKLKLSKYIVPEVSLDTWKKITKDKSITVICHGNLIESFFSLSYLEMLNYFAPQNKIFWSGNPKFLDLVKLNNIAKPSNENLADLVDKYPIPIFMDKLGDVYFNCLNHYKVTKPYYGGKGYKDTACVSKMALKNLTVPWNIQYIPKFRNINFPSREFLNWAKVARIDLNKPYVCFFYKNDVSGYKISTLNWNENQLKALAAMLRQQGILPLMFSNQAGKFYGSSFYCLRFNFETIIGLLEKAQAVLSNEIDFIILAMIVSKRSKIIMNEISKQYRVARDIRFLGLERSNIYAKWALTPLDAFDIIGTK